MCVDCTNSINDLPTGTSGEDGVSCYIYIGVADNDSGLNYQPYADAPDKCYKAILKSAIPIATIDLTYDKFDGLWFNTCGTPGTNGTNGTGTQGLRGDAASITLGTVATGAAGSNVIITNTGTTNDAVFNFTIPRGDTGATGTDGNIWTNGSGDPNSGADGITVGDMYLDTSVLGNGQVYEWDGSNWNIVTNITGPTGATGAQGIQGDPGADGTPKTLTSVDNSVTIVAAADNFDLSVKHRLRTFAAYVDIKNTAYSSASMIIPIGGVGDHQLVYGQVITEYNYYNYNNVTAATPTHTYGVSNPYSTVSTFTNFGTFNSSTGIFTITQPGMYFVNAAIHLKSDNTSSTDWNTAAYSSANDNFFALGITPDSAGDLYVVDTQVVTAGTYDIDISTNFTAAFIAGSKLKVKVLNKTDRNYNGSAYAGSDFIKFSITQLYY